MPLQLCVCARFHLQSKVAEAAPRGQLRQARASAALHCSFAFVKKPTICAKCICLAPLLPPTSVLGTMSVTLLSSARSVQRNWLTSGRRSRNFAVPNRTRGNAFVNKTLASVRCASGAPGIGMGVQVKVCQLLTKFLSSMQE